MQAFLTDLEEDIKEIAKLIPAQIKEYAWCMYGELGEDSGNCQVVFLSNAYGNASSLLTKGPYAAVEAGISATLTQQSPLLILERRDTVTHEFTLFAAKVLCLMAIPIGVSHAPHLILLVPADSEAERLRATTLYDRFQHDAGLKLLKRWMTQRTAFFTVARLWTLNNLHDLVVEYVKYVANWLRPQQINLHDPVRGKQTIKYHLPYTISESESFQVLLDFNQFSCNCEFLLPRINQPDGAQYGRREHRRNVLRQWISADFQFLASTHTQLREQRNQNIDELKKVLDSYRYELDRNMDKRRPPSQQPIAEPTASPPIVSSQALANHFYYDQNTGWNIRFKGHLIDVHKIGKGGGRWPGLTHIWNLIRVANMSLGRILRAYHLIDALKRSNTGAAIRTTAQSDKREKFLRHPQAHHQMMSKHLNQVTNRVVRDFNTYNKSWEKMSGHIDQQTAYDVMAVMKAKVIFLKNVKFRDPRQNAIFKRWEEIESDFSGIYPQLKIETRDLVYDEEEEYFIERHKCESVVRKNIQNMIKKVSLLGKEHPIAGEFADYLSATLVVLAADEPFLFNQDLAVRPEDRKLVWITSPPLTELKT